jgi:hypothetical protein
MKSGDVDRLLRAAANAPQDSAAEAPFGFDTRIVAAWRAATGSGNDFAELSKFLRRAGVVAGAILLLAGTAAYRQYRDEARFAAPTNEYAIADSAIQTEFSR